MLYFLKQAREHLGDWFPEPAFPLNNGTDPCFQGGNSTDTCDTATIKGFLIISPELIPICIMAAMIGYIGFTTIRPLKARGSIVYSITFAMFGVMMSDAAFVDCIMSAHGNQTDLVHIIFAVIDVGLTSSIGMSFFWDGLVDVGILSENITLYSMMFLSYVAIFSAWFYTIINEWWQGFIYFYVYLIFFCCGIYCITELIHLIQSRSATGLGWVFVAGVSGGIGLTAVYDANWDYWLCHNLGCHFSGDFIWFLLSDIAMWCCYKYYMARADIRSRLYQQSIWRQVNNRVSTYEYIPLQSTK